jgi:tRNA A-37 threonylcarbamoyl transferase component Bud32
MGSRQGEMLGRYRLESELGSGGMAVVYLGTDTALGRQVAVKVLHPHLSKKEESRRRFAREATAVARLHHPNILEVYDFSGEEAPEGYLVTEHIRGRTLRAWAAEGAFEPPELAALCAHELAAALAHAHAAGVVHRDLKPDNVMVREDGVLKLMDFGIARILDRDDRMTVTGALVGSPAHMAPEIIEGQEAGAAADIFSLGTVLYLLATGTLPFNAPNTTATLHRILECAYEDPRQVQPAVSDELAAIIQRCLQREPSARYPDAMALRDALAAYLSPLGFERPGEELAVFFRDPGPWRVRCRERLCTSLVRRAERALEKGAAPLALAAINQVLALDAQHAPALSLLDSMNRLRERERRARARFRLGAWVAGGMALSLGGFFLATRPVTRVAPAPGGVSGVPVAAQSPSGARSASGLPAERGGLSLTPAGGASEARRADLARGAPRPEGTVADSRPPSSSAQPAPGARAASPAATGVGPTSPAGGRQGTPRSDPTPSTAGPSALPPDGLRAASGQVPAPPVVRAASRPVAFTVQVRPFGTVQVDEGPVTPQALARHELQATPGVHQLRVSCPELCDEVVHRVELTDVSGQTLLLGARPRAARLAFDFQPRDARVTVLGETRSAGESLAAPFVVPGTVGARKLEHEVAWEVSRPGYATQRGVAVLKPGEPRILQGTLLSEGQQAGGGGPAR